MTWREWADRLCLLLGVPVSGSARRVIAAWIQTEGSEAAFNPHATTLRMPGSTAFNSVGVQNYVDAEQGLEATAKTLRFPGQGYERILRKLKHEDEPESIARAIGHSEWGTDGELLVRVVADMRRLWPEPGDRSIRDGS